MDDVAMGSPPGPTFANAFFCFYDKKWLEQCPDLNRFIIGDM